MKRPGFLIYLFGNPVSFIGLSLAVVAAFIAAAKGVVPFFVPIILLAIGAYARSANEKIAKYKAWKTEWDSMNVQSPSSDARRKSTGGFSFRYVLGFAAWAALAFLALSQANNHDMKAPVALFFLATVLLVVVGIMRLMRRRAGPASVGTAGPVAVCLAVPRQSTSAAQAFAALPGYCQQLISTHC